MPEYVLRNIDPDLWSRFTERANREGWPTKALFVALMDTYARGELTLRTAPPKELPQFAWLRVHYRAIAVSSDFAGLNIASQWGRLVDQVTQHQPGVYAVLDAIPPHRHAEVLDWLRRTSSLSPRQSLTLRAVGHVWSGPDMSANRRAFQYQVLGLPVGHDALIADFDGGWRIMHFVNGDERIPEWDTPHLTKEDALDTLARTLDGAD